MQTGFKKWKMILLNWAFVYPVINVIIPVVFPLTEGWPLPLRTLLLSGILVPTMAVVLPRLHRTFAGWLTK